MNARSTELMPQPVSLTSLMKNQNQNDGQRSVGAEPPISRADRDALLRYDRSRVRAVKQDVEAYGAHLSGAIRTATRARILVR